MADLQMKTIRYPGINNLYRFMQPDGTYPELTAGNIISNDAYNEDTEPYLFRALPYKSKRLEEDLVGATVNWNQLVKNGNFESTTNWTIYNATYSSIAAANDILTQTIPGGSSTNAYLYGLYQTSVIKVSAHKHLICADVKPSVDTTFVVDLGGGAKYTTATITANTKTKICCIKDAYTYNATFMLYPSSAVNNKTAPSMTIEYSNVICVDLTAMFGSTIADYVYSLEQATAGSGIAWLKSYGFFTKPYYEYDSGTLKSVNPTAHKMVGKNLIDQEILLEATGWQKNSDGEYYGTSSNLNSRFASNGVLMEMPYGTEQCAVSLDIYADGSGQSIYVIFDYENSPRDAVPMNLSTTKQRLTFVSGSGKKVKDIKLSYGSGGTWHISNLQIEFGSTATAYTPYEEHTYDLGNVPLYGLFQLVDNKLKAYGDVRHAEGGTDRKYGVVTFDSSSWTLYDQNTTNIRFAISKTIPLGKENSTNVIFTGGGTWSVGDTAAGTDTNKLDIRASIIVVSIAKSIFTGSTGTEFGAYMNGKSFVYEKATTTTEDTPSFKKIQSCFPYGTEEYITTNGVPVGHDTKYFKDVISSIAGIPEPPSGNGTYELKLTVTDGVASYSWVAV